MAERLSARALRQRCPGRALGVGATRAALRASCCWPRSPALALTARLGVWQLDRAAQKRRCRRPCDARAALPPLAPAELARNAEAAAAQHHRRVVLRGRWVAERTRVPRQPADGRPARLLRRHAAAARRADDAVLVQRGWVPRDRSTATRLPAVPTAGRRGARSRAASPRRRRGSTSSAARRSGPIRQNLDLGALHARPGLRCGRCRCCRPTAPPPRLTACCASGRLRRSTCTSTTAMPSSGSHSPRLMTGLYVWFQLIRPRLRHAADAARRFTVHSMPSPDLQTTRAPHAQRAAEDAAGAAGLRGAGDRVLPHLFRDPPGGRSNYGELIEPLRPLPAAAADRPAGPAGRRRVAAGPVAAGRRGRRRLRRGLREAPVAAAPAARGARPRQGPCRQGLARPDDARRGPSAARRRGR